MNSFLSVPIVLYSTARRIVDFLEELPDEGLSPMVEIHVEAFAVLSAVLRTGHVRHLEGVTPLTFKSMPCEGVVNILEGVCKLLCRGMTFVTPDGAFHILGTSPTIA